MVNKNAQIIQNWFAQVWLLADSRFIDQYLLPRSRILGLAVNGLTGPLGFHHYHSRFNIAFYCQNVTLTSLGASGVDFWGVAELSLKHRKTGIEFSCVDCFNGVISQAKILELTNQCHFAEPLKHLQQLDPDLIEGVLLSFSD